MRYSKGAHDEEKLDPWNSLTQNNSISLPGRETLQHKPESRQQSRIQDEPTGKKSCLIISQAQELGSSSLACSWHSTDGKKDRVNFAKAMPEMVEGKGCMHCVSFVGPEVIT